MFEPADGFSSELHTFEHPTANTSIVNISVMVTTEMVVRLDVGSGNYMCQ
jgi:hypothetical protein